jgi:hypothetical protein
MLIKSSLSEIARDRALQLYGSALALAYSATAGFLIYQNHYLRTVSKEVEPICWPFFESCYHYRIWSNFEIRAMLIAFALATLVPFFAFFRKKTRLGYFSLATLALWHVALIVQDFRNTQNQYYMLMWAVFAYLLWPQKRKTLQLLILSFYFWAGHLKLNEQWLSGQNLYAKLWLIPERLNAAACTYVVFLEMIMIWGLLSRNRAWFWATLTQLALFHVISISQIGTYYPALMFAILAIYPLTRLIAAPSATVDNSPRFSRAALALVAVFSFLQLYPSLVSRNRVISGVGRTFALNMFEGIFNCEAYWIEHYRDGTSTRIEAKKLSTERIQCEPIYYYSRTLNRCRAGQSDPRFVDLDFYMTMGRKTDPETTTIIRQTGFCAAKPGFHLLLPNTWIEN